MFDNESLEFLGDAVLGFVIADLLFQQFPQHNEGQKSKLKASLVSAASLARLGERISLGELPDPRPRRREDRRPPQARDHRRRLRSADRGHLSRRRLRSGPRVHPPPVPAPDRRGQRPAAARVSPRTTNRRCRSSCSAGTRSAGLSPGRPRLAPPTAAGSKSKSWSAARLIAEAEGHERRKKPSSRPRRRRWHLSAEAGSRLPSAVARIADSECKSLTIADSRTDLVHLDDPPCPRGARRAPRRGSGAGRRGARARRRALRARCLRRSGGVGRQWRRTHRRSIGSAKL